MRSHLDIDLAALTQNFHTLQAECPGSLAAVVKANAYGLGAAQVGPQLAAAGCREFFVAILAEGIALREVLPDSIIYVLAGPAADERPAYLRHNLTPVLNTLNQCRAWQSTGRPAALHVDTGMQRLGLAPAEVDALPLGGLRIDLLLSDLARADEVGHPATLAQWHAIEAMHVRLAAIFPELRLSLTNSPGVLGGELAELIDAAGVNHLGRTGVALYGSNPLQTVHVNPLQTVVTLLAKVQQVRQIPANTPVGYGGTYQAQTPRVLAVLDVGYADGVPRLLSNQGQAYLAGKTCNFAGRVSMDLVTLDVTAAAEVHAIEEGMAAEIFGAHISIDQVAEQAGTIAYEILTGLGQRLERCYLNPLVT